jgi:hypothetical protein
MWTWGRWAALLTCLPLGACASSGGGSQAGSGPAVAPMQHPMLEGLPIPNGFELVPERSFYSSSGQLRYAACEYRGATDPLSVSRFYREYMPSAGFTFRQESFIGGEHLLAFDSNTEQTTIRVKRDVAKTVLVIQINPTPKGSAEREVKPPAKKP